MAVQVPTGSLPVGLENSSTNRRKLTFCQFINPTRNIVPCGVPPARRALGELKGVKGGVKGS